MLDSCSRKCLVTSVLLSEMCFGESNGGKFFIKETVKSNCYQSARFCC